MAKSLTGRDLNKPSLFKGIDLPRISFKSQNFISSQARLLDPYLSSPHPLSCEDYNEAQGLFPAKTLVQALADVITVRTTPADFIVANHELITGPRNSQHVSLDSNVIIA
ncbi:hypothetical protein YC2023_017078 [Brassica napus]